MRTDRKIIAWIACILPLAIGTAHGQSTIANGTVNNGSTHAESGGLRLTGVIGQPLVGLSYSAGNIISSGFWQQETGIITSIEPETDAELPKAFELYQNYPNPFNPSTTITFSVPSDSEVRIEIFDMLGRSIENVFNDHVSAGEYRVLFDAARLSSGIYLYRMTAGTFVKSRRLVLLK